MTPRHEAIQPQRAALAGILSHKRMPPTVLLAAFNLSSQGPIFGQVEPPLAEFLGPPAFHSFLRLDRRH
jgi:hypothetical protein